jgi:hypothetical protein
MPGQARQAPERVVSEGEVAAGWIGDRSQETVGLLVVEHREQAIVESEAGLPATVGKRLVLAGIAAAEPPHELAGRLLQHLLLCCVDQNGRAGRG